jgi:hypothetical protein
MADEAAALCARAERELALRNVRDALAALEKAYVPVQTTRDLGTVRYALDLTQKAATSAFNRRDARKARRIAEWYGQLERSYTDAVARPAKAAVTSEPVAIAAPEPEPEPEPHPEPEPAPDPEPAPEPDPDPVVVVAPVVEARPVAPPSAAVTAARRPARDKPAAGTPPGWIDRLIPGLGVLIAIELVGGMGIAVAAHQTTWRIAAAAGSIFWASVLVSVIAILRLLQRVEQNTRPAPRARRRRAADA